MKISILDRLIIIVVPIIVSLIICIFLSIHLVKIKYDINQIDQDELMKFLLNTWVTLLGFLITAVSILLTFNGGPKSDIIKNSEHFPTILFSYLYFCFLLFVFIIIFVPVLFTNYWNFNVFIFLIFTSICTAIQLLLSLYFLFVIVWTAIK